MNCPICKVDLSPLDFVSRTEHVDLCVENGPAILDYSETGQAVIRKNIPPNKQRKICPTCDKTFQAIHVHYKKCALKNDILPDLMFDHWEQLNKDSKATRKFPRDLLEGFIARRIKEGRAGEQVEYARGLLLSMTESEPDVGGNTNGRTVAMQQHHTDILVNIDDTNQSTANSTSSHPPNRQLSVQEADHQSFSAQGGASTVEQVLMQAAAAAGPATLRRGKPNKKFSIELVDDVVKRVNIDLRRERELAASARRRFDRIQAAIDEQERLGESSTTQEDGFTICWLDRLS